MGYKAAPALQFECMSDDLKTEIHNAIRLLEKPYYWKQHGPRLKLPEVYKLLWSSFFLKDLDSFDEYLNHYIPAIKSLYDKLEWFEVYDYIEQYLIYSRAYNTEFADDLTRLVNHVLEKHNSAYRIQDGHVIPISNEQELSEVSEASHTGQKAIDTHIRRAIWLFSQRESKDYANVIKEAISAVEAAVNIVNGTEGTTLGEALKTLDKTRKIPEALKQGFEKLYGYTNDKETGIRHALINNAQCPPDFADAKFMLVACSAFVNWILLKSK